MENRKIYIVGIEDPAKSNLKAYETQLKTNGYNVTNYGQNIAFAFEKLSTIKERALVILERKLIPIKGTEVDGRIDRSTTQNYNFTGFTLINELTKENPDMFPQNAVIYDTLSQYSSENSTCKSIKLLAEELDIPLMREDNTFGFVNRLERIFKIKFP